MTSGLDGRTKIKRFFFFVPARRQGRNPDRKSRFFSALGEASRIILAGYRLADVVKRVSLDRPRVGPLCSGSRALYRQIIRHMSAGHPHGS
jgi:hypothetical protein